MLVTDSQRDRLFDRFEDEYPEHLEDVRSLYRAVDRGIISRSEAWKEAARLLDETLEELIETIGEHDERNAKLLEYIPTLKSQFATGLLSNVSSRENLSHYFERGQLETLFNTVVASGDEGIAKPDPEIYRIIATRLNAEPSECVFIDDNELFCQTARDLGMKTIHYQSAGQAIRETEQYIDRGEQRA